LINKLVNKNSVPSVNSDCGYVSHWIKYYTLFIVAIRINFETTLSHRGIRGLISAALFSCLLICHYCHVCIRSVRTKEYEDDVTSGCFHIRFHILSVFWCLKLLFYMWQNVPTT